MARPHPVPVAPVPTATSSYPAPSPPTLPSPSPESDTALELYQPSASVETATASAGWLQIDHPDSAPQMSDTTDTVSLIGATSKLAFSCIRSGARLTSSLLESATEGIAYVANYADEHGTQMAENIAMGIKDVVGATAGALGELAGPAVAVTRSTVVLGAEMTAWTARKMGEHGPDALRSIRRTLSGIGSSFVEGPEPPRPKSRLGRLGSSIRSRLRRSESKEHHDWGLRSRGGSGKSETPKRGSIMRRLSRSRSRDSDREDGRGRTRSRSLSSLGGSSVGSGRSRRSSLSR